MIKHAHIRHFKGLSELEVSSLARVTLLGGRNNVGKTSVLEALFLHIDRYNPEVLLRQYHWRNIPTVSLTPDALWAPVFSMYDMEKPVQINIRDEQDRSAKLTLQLNRDYVRGIRQGIGSLSGMIDTQAKPSSGLALDVIYQLDNEREQRAHHTIDVQGIKLEAGTTTFSSEIAYFHTAIGRISPQEDAVRFGQLDIIGKQQEVVDFLKEAVEPRLSELSAIAVGDQILIHAKLEGFNRKIPVAYMGDGMRLEHINDRIEGKTYSHAVLGAALERNWEVR